MIRPCHDQDLNTIFEIINDAAVAYKGVIPADRWHEPYLPMTELRREIQDGVRFSGWEENGRLLGVMGIQDVLDVTLIRHAYVRTNDKNKGIGGRLLQYLLSTASCATGNGSTSAHHPEWESREWRPTGRPLTAERPVLIGTWKDAVWAIRFYEKHGFRLVTETEKDVLLCRYWKIPTRQVETSVVLRKVAELGG